MPVLGWGLVSAGRKQGEQSLSLRSRKGGREATRPLGVSHPPHVYTQEGLPRSL